MRKQPGSLALADALVMINLLGTCGKKHEWCIFNMIFILRFSVRAREKEIEFWKKTINIQQFQLPVYKSLGFDDIWIYHQLLPSDLLIIQMKVTELTPEKVSQSLPTGETNESPLKSDTCFVPISDGLGGFLFCQKNKSHMENLTSSQNFMVQWKLGCISNSIFQILNYFPLKHDSVKKSAESLPETWHSDIAHGDPHQHLGKYLSKVVFFLHCYVMLVYRSVEKPWKVLLPVFACLPRFWMWKKRSQCLQDYASPTKVVAERLPFRNREEISSMSTDSVSTEILFWKMVEVWISRWWFQPRTFEEMIQFDKLILKKNTN